jgi:hypothetical protein
MLYSESVHVFHTSISKKLYKALMITKKSSQKNWNLIFFDFSNVSPPKEFQDAYMMQWDDEEKRDFQVKIYKEIFHLWNKNIGSSFKFYDWALDYCLKQIYYRPDV